MLGLGLRLSVRGGREALIRLALTTAAVAVGVAVLLAVLADHHAFEHASTRPSWESTTAAAPGRPAAGEELWNYSENIYAGRFVEQLDVAALGPQAPIVPGLPRLPDNGQFYASPALAALLRSTPHDQLGDRFPGTQVGLIGDTALSGPSEFAAVIGHSADQLAALPGTIRVDTITTAPHPQGTTNLYRLAFGIGAIALLFPLLILINTATRLAAARREERYAAMRLVGATPHQVNVLASVDAVVSALLGTALGIGVFLLIRPALARIGLSGAQFFADTVTPTVWGYAGMLVAVPLGRRGGLAGVAAQGADDAAGGRSKDDATSTDGVAGATAAGRHSRVPLPARSQPRRPGARAGVPRPGADHARPGAGRVLADDAGGAAACPRRPRRPVAAGRAPARRQPESRLPGGQRAGPRGLRRHADRRRAPADIAAQSRPGRVRRPR